MTYVGPGPSHPVPELSRTVTVWVSILGPLSGLSPASCPVDSRCRAAGATLGRPAALISPARSSGAVFRCVRPSPADIQWRPQPPADTAGAQPRAARCCGTVWPRSSGRAPRPARQTWPIDPRGSSTARRALQTSLYGFPVV